MRAEAAATSVQGARGDGRFNCCQRFILAAGKPPAMRAGCSLDRMPAVAVGPSKSHTSVATCSAALLPGSRRPLTTLPSCLVRRGDVIKVETWFQEDGKLAAQRDWRVSDAATGQELGRATSTWVMINMQTRRLVKLPEPMRRKCEAFQQTPARHAIPRENTRRKLPELELPAEVICPGRWPGGLTKCAVPSLPSAARSLPAGVPQPLLPCWPGLLPSFSLRRLWARYRWLAAPTWT